MAGSYMDLKPGSSEKKDADRVFGNTVREMFSLRRYDYSPQGHDLKRLSLVLKEDRKIIESIELYFKAVYPPQEVKQWFSLDMPDQTSFDREGNLIEYYTDQGLALYYDGPQPGSGVRMLSHYDPLATVKKIPLDQYGTGREKGRLYLGAAVSGYSGEGIKIVSVSSSSPASRAGLRSGDIILEMGNNKFYARDIDPGEFVSVLEMMSGKKPVSFLIQRGSKKFSLEISLVRISEEERQRRYLLDREQAEQYKKEARSLWEDRRYREAIPVLEKITALDPQDSACLALLGYSYDKTGQIDKAITALTGSLALKEEFSPALLLGRIYAEQKQYAKAIPYLEKAVDLQKNPGKDLTALETLGVCYFEEKQFQDSLNIFVRSYKIKRTSPLSVFYLGACSDKLGKIKNAVYYYRKYLSLSHGNSTMQSLARTRLKALDRASGSKSKTSDSVLKIFKAINREMEDFNRD